MGGRGSYASTNGNNKNLQFKYAGKLHEFPILVSNGKTSQHGLPMENHLSPGYVKLRSNGMFQELRVYDSNHRCRLEIAYHHEERLAPRGQNVLHYHQYTWDGDKISRSTATLLPKDSVMYRTYKKFFIGVPEQ